MADQKQLVVDKEKVQKAAKAGVPLALTTYVLPHEMEVYMNEILTCFLDAVGQNHMTDYLVYCLNELTANAKKANTKRVYFKEKKLNINDPADYEKGMVNFKEDTLADINHYLRLQRDAGLYIKVSFLAKNGKIKLEVRNNSELNFFEYKRIHDRICRAQIYSTMQEAMNNLVDETEGAGLGLLLMILMLKKVGLTEDSYQVLVEGQETIVRVELPFADRLSQEFEKVSDEISQVITELSSFPENITKLNELLEQPEVEMTEIADFIQNDVALTADLLKLVNSAAFRNVSSCQSVLDAVKIVGLYELRNLVYSLGTISILGDKTPEQKKIWQHSFRVAFYAQYIAKNFFPKEKELISRCYVCGLLHDIGKVIFTNVHMSQIRQLEDVTKQKQIPIQIIEQLAAGANHEVLGSLIAKKWNFPDGLVAAIRYHHSPFAAPEEFEKLVMVVAFANQLANYHSGIIVYSQFMDEVCAFFDFNKDESDELKAFSEVLQEVFNEKSS